MPAWPPTGFVRDTWNRQHKMGLHFPLHPLLTIPTVQPLLFSPFLPNYTPSGERCRPHKTLGTGRGIIWVSTDGASQTPPGKGLTMQGTSIGTGTLIDKSTYRIEKCHKRASISLAMAPGALKFQKKSCGLSGLQSASLVALH